MSLSRVMAAIVLAVAMLWSATPAMAAAPTWLEISGGGLKRPIIVLWEEDAPEIRGLDWTWAVSCYPQCDPESLLDPNSLRRIESPPVVVGVPYVLQWKFGPPVTRTESVVAEWQYHPEADDGPGLMQLLRHEGVPSWQGMWFTAKPENDGFLLRLLLENGCTRGGGIPCVPLGQEHSFVRMKWAVIR